MTMSSEISDDEEPNLPEKYTQSELRTWSSRKTMKQSGNENQGELVSDARSLLRSSEQHQQGLSVFMKRCRRDIIMRKKRPQLVKEPNRSLPVYLQDIERFNCDLMNHVNLQEHCTLPSKAIIEDEKRIIKEEGKKSWSVGRILHHNASLVDPTWKKEMEEKFISQEQKRARERMAHVILGVLDQWQETQERGAGTDPISPDPTSLKKSSSNGNKEDSPKSIKDNTEKESNSGKKTLETVPEDEEETDEYFQFNDPTR